MDASEAREHLEIIERIVAASSRKLEAGGEFFLVWGLISASIMIVSQLVAGGRLPQNALFVPALAIAAGVIYTIIRARRQKRCGERMSLLQREFLNVLWVTIGMACVVNVAAFNLFGAWGQFAIWSAMGAVVLFYVGMHGNRRALAGGVVLVVSIAVANYTPHYPAFVLAAGMLVGYAGFGLAELLARE